MLSDDLLAFAKSKGLAALMARAMSPDFWRGLCPQLTISSEPFADLPSPLPLKAKESSQLVDQIVEEGYFQTAPLFSSDEIQPLAAAVSAVVDQGYPPLFATVYDEPWKLLAALGNVLNPILGAGFRVIPDFWLWHVAADPRHSGWAPHRDAQYPNTLRPDGRPTLLTIWIPFTDATPLNSCIYVLPLPRDPNYPRNIQARTIDLPQDVRALPAKAGSILGWNQYLLHWGSRSCRRAGQPRISWGIYFQSGDVPLFDPLARKLRGPLTFEERLAFIGTAIARYAGQSTLPHPLDAFVLWARRVASGDEGE
jgi:hypothetical protein